LPRTEPSDRSSLAMPKLKSFFQGLLEETPRRVSREQARLRGWKSATEALEKMRNDLEAQLGEKLFLIADTRDRASEISFYLHDKRVEGPGHPPAYIPESQDMVNQFSFWPRYDQFVELKPGMQQPEGEVYTEENGINLFVGRDALFVRAGEKEHVPRNIQAAFQS